MIGLLQRVTQARVEIRGELTAAIGPGLLVLIAVRPEDTALDADRLLDRVLKYRVFDDDAGRMNHSLTEFGGGLLLVPQFTLAADTRKGLRPSFGSAAPPQHGRPLFERLVDSAAQRHAGPVASGVFGADMQVSLTNDGPVTIWLES